jgi:hypothetical protein
MSTIQPTLKRTSTRWPGAVMTTAGALIAILIAVAVLFLALAGESRGHHAAISHPTATYYPLIHYRGTGGQPAPTAGTRPAPAPDSRHKSYGLVP